jgi:hypothetical protein
MASDFTITLERVFQGPMDLLLHLVREQEVEIHEVELSKVISAYLAYLEALRELDIELAGDFLVMASTLMSIKSRSLLPREEIDLAEELDPRNELIQRPPPPPPSGRPGPPPARGSIPGAPSQSCRRPQKSRCSIWARSVAGTCSAPSRA